jgi:hypothetical protein
MNARGILELWFPAACNLFGSVDIDNRAQAYLICSKLDRALNVTVHQDYCARHSSSDTPLEPDMVELLEKLKGPYGKAILRAYQIKKGITP